MPSAITQAGFLSKARAVHGEKYDYSQAVYTGVKNKLIIICPQHGPFNATPDNHFQGNGCKECGFERLRQFRSDSLESFLKKARAVHGEKYDYSQAVYTGTTDKLLLACPKHGPFKIAPNNHLQGAGCKQCGFDKLRKGQAEFIAQARAVHGEKYDYSQAVYKQTGVNLIVTCPTHGPFLMAPQNHLLGQGCRKCSNAARRPCWSAGRWAAAQAGRLAQLYVVRMEGKGEIFYKVGITLNTLHRRFLSGCPYKVEPLKVFALPDAHTVHKIEGMVKKRFRSLHYKPAIHFNGHTECFTDAGPILTFLNDHAELQGS